MTTNIETPANLKDSPSLLSESGFKTSNVWYHGTTSGLTDAILKEGLKRSGDKEINNVTKKAMATIGNNYTERKDPVFLTQSKELAFFWANEKVRTRKVHTGNDETPAIIAVTLPEDLNGNVKPDVGAVVMLMDLHQYMGQLENIYQERSLPFDLDNLQAQAMEIPREDYLNKLGLAYYQNDIDSQYLSLVSE